MVIQVSLWLREEAHRKGPGLGWPRGPGHCWLEGNSPGPEGLLHETSSAAAPAPLTTMGTTRDFEELPVA